MIGWANWRELARLALDLAITHDEDGGERWLVDTEGEIDWLVDSVST